MPDDPKTGSGFKVVDRRPFTEDGTVRQHPPEERTVEAEKSVGRPLTAPARPPVSAPRESELSELGEEEGASDFETLVSYLSTTAMFQLGLLPGPSGERIPLDLENARRTIDMLEVLRHKTQGNLTAEEAKLLEDVLYELRLSFVELERRRAQKAK